MSFAPNISTTFLLIATVCILLPQAHAFGAGDIPDFAYLNDKAFRHGDIESILENLAKTAGGAAIGGSGILEFATSVVKAAAGPSKFSKSDVKKVYFGNWLRDYSQAMDIAGLTKLSADTLVLVVSVLGFMTFGFSTEEFEVTADRLGVYLPVEHIDNPKGYAEKEGDARQFHPKLRPPVERRELEIDTKTGMKKYMATENEGFDTSTAFIRRTLKSCIEHGRRAKGREGKDLWEAYRLLGTGLHTLEDFTAHSNWCEIALRKMGHKEVFCHVGDRVTVNTPNGPAPPIVTGTFGGADFLHSLLGEAGDKLSQASVTDLSGKLNEAQGKQADLGPLKGLLGKIMGGGDHEEKLNQGQQMHQQAQGYHFNPDNVAPPEVQKQLLDLLKWHDDVMRAVIKKISMVPGLTDLLEEFSNALNAYIYTVLAPYLTPILTQATSALNEGSKAVIDHDDQYEVFDNANASDPSHSLLSKDHFGLILNEPAGKIAQIVVEHSVNEIVQAWSSDENPDRVLDRILEAFHHPYYSTGSRGSIQYKMFEEMQKWLGGLGPEDAKRTIQALTKQSVRDHKNKRLGSEDQSFDEPGYRPCGHGTTQRPTGGVTSSTNARPGYSAEAPSGSYGRNQSGGSGNYQQSHSSSGYGSNTQGGRSETSSYGGRNETSSNTYGGRINETSSGRNQSSYANRDESSYGRQSETTPSYGSQQSSGYGQGGSRRDEDRQDSNTYGGRTTSQETSSGRNQSSYANRDDSHGRQSETTSAYGVQQSYGGRTGGNDTSSGRNQSSYANRDEPSYGRQSETTSKYGGRTTGNEISSGRNQSSSANRDESYGRQGETTSSYGGQQSSGYGASQYQQSQTTSGYGSQQSYGSRREEEDKPKYGGGSGGYGSHRRQDSDEDKHKYRGGEGTYGRDNDDNKPKHYGQQQSSGYGGGGSYGSQRRKDSNSDDEKPKGGGAQRRKDSNDSDDEKKRNKYGKKNKDDSDSDNGSRKNKGGNERHQSGYAPSYQAGYAPSYSSGGSQNQTYGVERMNIRGDESDEEKRRRQYGGGRY